MSKRPRGLTALQVPETTYDYGITDSEASSSRGSPETVSSRGSPETIESESPGSVSRVGDGVPLQIQRPMPIPPKLAPLLLPNNITNIENIPEGNFGDMINPKRANTRKFFLRKKSPESLASVSFGVEIYFFQNIAENTFTKTFVYSKSDDPQTVLIKILSEVYYHQKFYNLQETCKFKAPKLIEYGYVENGASTVSNEFNEINGFMFYVKMERTDALQVSKLTGDDAIAKCNYVRSKLVAINDCLEKNSLYHNDLSADNVMINGEGDIVIIDFGEASDTMTHIAGFDNFCPREKKRVDTGVEGSNKLSRTNGGRKSRKHIKVIKRGATKRRPAKKMRRTIKKRRSSRRARK